MIGDIKAIENEESLRYEISNAYLKLYVQDVIIENDYNSLYLKSVDGKKEKMVNLDVYRQVISNQEAYRQMLQW